jgi:hypothetical protein
VASTISGAFSAAGQGIVSAFGAVTSYLGRAFTAYIQAGSAVASGLAAAFTSFKSAAMESLSAIATSMMQGEFALAGEIAWASIKLSFAEGIAWATNAWTEFATGLASIWDATVTKIRQVWANVSTWIAGQLLRIWGLVQNVASQLGIVDQTLDVQGAIRTLQEDRDRFNVGLDTARGQRDDQRVAAMQSQLAATEERLAALRTAREQALAKARDLPVDERESPLAQAMADLKAAIAEAAKAPKLFDAGAATRKVADVGGDLAPMVTSKPLEGTFSAAAAMAMFGARRSSAEEETAQNTRAMRRRLDELAREQRLREGMVFA